MTKAKGSRLGMTIVRIAGIAGIVGIVRMRV